MMVEKLKLMEELLLVVQQLLMLLICMRLEEVRKMFQSCKSMEMKKTLWKKLSLGLVEEWGWRWMELVLVKKLKVVALDKCMHTLQDRLEDLVVIL